MLDDVKSSYEMMNNITKSGWVCERLQLCFGERVELLKTDSSSERGIVKTPIEVKSCFCTVWYNMLTKNWTKFL